MKKKWTYLFMYVFLLKICKMFKFSKQTNANIFKKAYLNFGRNNKIDILCVGNFVIPRPPNILTRAAICAHLSYIT